MKSMGGVYFLNDSMDVSVQSHLQFSAFSAHVQHTKQCMCCSKALENFKKAQTVLTVLAAVLTGVGAVLPQTLHRFVAVACAAVCALIAWRLSGWIQMFTYKGWDHAHLD